MGSIMSAIRDDIEEYEALCSKYGEGIQYSPSGSAACYSDHAARLKFRSRVEWKMSQGWSRKRAEADSACYLPNSEKEYVEGKGWVKVEVPQTAWDHILKD